MRFSLFSAEFHEPHWILKLSVDILQRNANACILFLSKFISNLDPLLRKITYNLSSICPCEQCCWHKVLDKDWHLKDVGEGEKKSCKMASNLITSLEIVLLMWCVCSKGLVCVNQVEQRRPSRGTCLTWAANDCQHLSTVDLEAQIVDSFLLVSLHLPRHFELWQPLVPGDLRSCVHLGARSTRTHTHTT